MRAGKETRRVVNRFNKLCYNTSNSLSFLQVQPADQVGCFWVLRHCKGEVVKGTDVDGPGGGGGGGGEGGEGGEGGRHRII